LKIVAKASDIWIDVEFRPVKVGKDREAGIKLHCPQQSNLKDMSYS
jgi:hypothetical protein